MYTDQAAEIFGAIVSRATIKTETREASESISNANKFLPLFLLSVSPCPVVAWFFDSLLEPELCSERDRTVSKVVQIPAKSALFRLFTGIP
jgi:hypothetical protein